MVDTAVRETFDRLANDYDALKLLIIPKYEELTELIDGYFSATAVQEYRVLELGTGTGQWAEQFLVAHPQAIYEGVEFAEKMRQAAIDRLEPYGARAKIVNDDLNEIRFSGKYDLVVSFFTIHHVRDKGALFKKVYQALVGGGRFVYADITVARHQQVEDFFIQHWVDIMKRSALPDERIPMVLKDHWENDLPETIENQLEYLSGAGFDSFDLIWRFEKFAVFFGQR